MPEHPAFTVRVAARQLIACWARLLGRECTHPPHLRTHGIPFYADKCACGLLVRLPEVTSA